MSKDNKVSAFTIQLFTAAEDMGLGEEELKNIFDSLESETKASKLSEEEAYSIFVSICNAILNQRLTKKELREQLGDNFAVGVGIADKVLKNYYN